MSWRVLEGDVRDVLRTLPDRHYHCVVTSPPYWGLRDYGVAGQIGLEETPQAFIAKMVDVFREVRRVLRDDGTCWVNMGDSYVHGQGGRQSSVGELPRTHRRARAEPKERDDVDVMGWSERSVAPRWFPSKDTGWKPKDLVGMPWMLAFALRDDGWYLRQDIIWHKPNPMPESVRDRCTKAHEYIFLLTKKPRYYYDAEAIAEDSTAGFNGSSFTSEYDIATKPGLGAGDRADTGRRNKRSVWTMSTQAFSEAHFATFPITLPTTCIKAGKIRHRMLQVSVRQDGTMSWIRSRLEEFSNDVRDLGGNALHVGGFGDLGVVICVADADGHVDSRFNTRDYAATNPICYVTINPRAAEGRLLKDDWIRRVGLADLVAGDVDLGKTLTELAAAAPPTSISKADIPVCAKGHILIQPEQKPHQGRLFYVELSDDVVRVDGEIVVNPQAGPRLKLFRILWRQFVEDTSNGLPANGFTALNFRRLLDMMEKEDHRYDDENSLRKVINRLQSDIETAVKRKLGKPIDREDVVQTCRMTNQSDTSAGYRLNPFTVAIRPPQAR